METLSTVIRSFNRSGIEEFQTYLRRFSEGYLGKLPAELILSASYSSPVTGNVIVDQQQFKLKVDAARYLSPKIEQLQIPNKYYATGLWAWLTAFYFDSICPSREDGSRKIYPDYAYIPGGSLVFHRHLLALPIRIFRMHGDMPRVMLQAPLERANEFTNELAFRQELAVNRGVLEAANILYWSELQQKPKSGATNKRRAGSLRRFISVISQLDLTYDLQSMSGEQIVRLLPEHEFSEWLQE